MRFAIPILFALSIVASADEPAKKRPSVSDQKTGMSVSVGDDDRTLTAVDTKTGKAIWKTNVIDAAGKPNAGQPVIRDLSIKDGVLTAIYGKNSFAKFELKSGKLMEKGSD
jgi:outer membrane protein assembly factor BamB